MTPGEWFVRIKTAFIEWCRLHGTDGDVDDWIAFRNGNPYPFWNYE